MRKLLLALSVITILFLAGCLKSDDKCYYNDSTVVASETEIMALQDSLDAHGITGTTMHPSGFFYKINSQGSGKSITNLCTYILVEYEGKFFNGKKFDFTDEGTPRSFQLGQLIAGWQKGIPLLNKGGNITLYIPPSLAYGPNPVTDAYGKPVLDEDGNQLIPGNSYLVFNLALIDLQ